MISPRRLYAPVVLGLIIVGGVTWWAARRPWASVVVGSGESPASRFDLLGSEVAAVAAALAIVAVAGALGVIASAGRVRQVVGAALALAAIAGIAATRSSPTGAIESRVNDSPALSPSDPVVSDPTAWPWVTAGLFVVVAALALIVVIYGRRWPTMSSRYERESGATRPAAETTSADLWKAIDQGHDPTADGSS